MKSYRTEKYLMKFFVLCRTGRIAILNLKILICDFEYEESYFTLIRHNWTSFKSIFFFLFEGY